jgi:4-hydroxythreonine-4-phosphate dehydrogenase
MLLPRIAVTMGDPAGIGPELCLRLLDDVSVRQRCTPIIFGDAEVLTRVAQQIGAEEPRLIVRCEQWTSAWRALDQPAVLDLRAVSADAVQPGAVSATSGLASYEYVDFAITAALAGQVDAIATGPIHKEAFRAAGIPYPGHTEMFADKTRASRVCMMLTSHEVTCSLVTTHVGLREVPGLLNTERILEVIQLSADAISRMRGRQARLIVCGLNPHAGESGLFGDREEQRLIAPAIQSARGLGIQVEGPLPPDTAFIPARRRETDCYVCMYHDQGLIPLKALAFDTAVNITLGLPIVRTSVDHGTALDIAWQGKADVTSLSEAVKLAAKLAPEPAVHAERKSARSK